MTRLLKKNWQLEELGNRHWQATASENTRFDDCLKPEWWRDVTDDPERGMVQGDVIWLRHERGEFFALLLVVDRGIGWAKVKAMLVDGIAENLVVQPEGAALVAKWKINTRSVDVIRSDDGEIIPSGFGTKAAALVWIEEHEKKVAA